MNGRGFDHIYDELGYVDTFKEWVVRMLIFIPSGEIVVKAIVPKMWAGVSIITPSSHLIGKTHLERLGL